MSCHGVLGNWSVLVHVMLLSCPDQAFPWASRHQEAP
jgi:hypothetical protein